jgi:hypothetical protein
VLEADSRPLPVLAKLHLSAQRLLRFAKTILASSETIEGLYPLTVGESCEADHAYINARGRGRRLPTLGLDWDEPLTAIVRKAPALMPGMDSTATSFSA